ncbi:MAG: response regulator [Candidatus Omnitrophica bacterium]|nr:response regulator [Candidatus Omnitrophota bacterium]MCM8831584.1 response regulator [Candidatus Omnitrophota bacterium]
MEKIVIIEDDKNLLNFLENSLAKYGFMVFGLDSGKDAFKKIEEINPEFIILDIMLPYIGGLEILNWVKTNYPHIKVILATAKDKIEDIKTGFSLNADYYLTKPYTISEILKAIELLKAIS